MLLKYWKRTIAWALVFALVLPLVPIMALAVGGDGTEGNPHLISSLAELEDFRDSVNSGNPYAGEYFKLTADIDMSAKYNETMGVSWEVIGNTQESTFQGTFDGGGHTIRGLYIHKTSTGNESEQDCFGALFGFIEGGTIQNLNVQGSVSVAARDGEAAGIAVVLWDGAIVNCTFDGTVQCPNYVAAGITAGGDGIISGCKTSGRITGQHMVAGMVGSGGGTIINCVNESEMISTRIGGGIAGYYSGKIEGCVNRGSVTGRFYHYDWVTEEGETGSWEEASVDIGGIVGIVMENSAIENCCNTGAVSGNNYVGGILGQAEKWDQESEIRVSVKNCLNTGNVTCTFEEEGDHSIGSIAGNIVSEIWDHDADAYFPGVVAADVGNCYYLAGTAEAGVGPWGEPADTTTAKTAEELASGEVAYLLQEGNGGNTSTTVWGQNLRKDAVPVLTDSAEKAVYKLTFMVDETEYAMKYANPSGPATLPDNPDKSGFTFGGWCKDAACTTVWDFGTDTVTEDMTLYAKWTENSTDDDPPTPPSKPDSVIPVNPSPAPDEPVTWENPYSDVNETSWYYEAVRFANKNGLFYGTSDTTFSPNDDMTRGMLATVLYRLAKEPGTTAKDLFSDVADGKYYSEAIAWAAENKIVAGYGDNRFGPEDSITREQLATILWRYAGSPESTGSLAGFTDGSKTAEYAVPALQWAVEQGIVSGKGNGILDPRGQATRAEVATMLMRYCETL